MPALKRALLATTIAAAMAATPIHATAADIWVGAKKITKTEAALYIKGDIEMGDDEKFRKVLLTLAKPPIVVLNSGGGKIVPGLNIGILIRKLKLKTLAYKTCASVCALAWLGGTQRMVFNDSAVGFHSAFNTDTGAVDGSANAVIGAYLSKLGFNYDTIIYLTTAAPNSMEWLNAAKATKYGVAVSPQ